MTISGLFWNSTIFPTSQIRTSVTYWNYIQITVEMARLSIRLYSTPSLLSIRGVLPSKETSSSKHQEGSLCSNALRVKMFGPIVRHYNLSKTLVLNFQSLESSRGMDTPFVGAVRDYVNLVWLWPDSSPTSTILLTSHIMYLTTILSVLSPTLILITERSQAGQNMTIVRNRYYGLLMMTMTLGSKSVRMTIESLRWHILPIWAWHILCDCWRSTYYILIS